MSLAYQPHNHAACIQSALNYAQSICDKNAAKLTPIRKQVLTLIWQSHKPLGAYDLIEMVSQSGKRTAPPTIYRALEFLQSLGLIHRLSTLNAFIGCSVQEEHHEGCFLICTECNNVEEMNASDTCAQLKHKVAPSGFTVNQTQIEVSGICAQCSSSQERNKEKQPS